MDKEQIKWFIQVFIMTFILSMLFSYISANGVSNLSLIPAILILILVIGIGIFFDIIGVAVTVANEHEFHAKASKKIEGSKASIKLINITPTFSLNWLMKITEQFGLSFNIQFILSATVAALTVGGKALGKGVANNNSTKIVHAVGIVLNKFSRK